MIREIGIADAIGADGCVLHLGKAVSDTLEHAIDHMYNNICAVIDAIQTQSISAKLFLETSSGQGTEILHRIKDLAAFWKRFPKKYHSHLALCVDTCHIWAAGCDISNVANVDMFFETWEKDIGIKHIGVVHLNNSVHDCGARKDRHACIQYGKIPIDGLQAFYRVCVRHNIPCVLETPEGVDEIAVLRKAHIIM